MASLDTLPPDQRAVLELVLRRGRSYDEIAQLLSIDRAGVRARALAALDALAPETGVPAERRALITDYLLGALPPAVADEVRDGLGQSPSERAWARVVAGELQPVASGPLPEIPVEAAARATEPQAPVSAAEPLDRPADSPSAGRQARPVPPGRRSSRRGGALLLAAIAVVVVAVVLVVVLSGGSSKHPASASRASTTTTPKTGKTTSTTATKVVAQINLDPPSGGAARGIAEVLSEKGKTGIAIVAQGLAANRTSPPNAYAVWLYNSPTDSQLLGFVNPGVKSNGKLQTAGGLPADAGHFQKLLVTLETKSHPKIPGSIVLEGTLTGVS